MEMKTGEMYSLVLTNPKAKFKRLNCNVIYRFSDTGKLVLDKDANTLAMALEADEDWELIKEPVPWQKAIQAWIDGKEIYIEFKGEKLNPDNNLYMQFKIFRNNDYKWYIKD